MTGLQLLMIYVWRKKSHDQPLNEHVIHKKKDSLCKTDQFSNRQLKSQNVCYEKIFAKEY